jgi:DNA-binding MarR family transcriptional regulator
VQHVQRAGQVDGNEALISRMERDGHVVVAASGQDRHSRVVTMSESGRHVWQDLALPKIRAYYEEILGDFSVNDVTRTLHCLLKILENMQRIDTERASAEDVEDDKAVA